MTSRATVPATMEHQACSRGSEPTAGAGRPDSPSRGSDEDWDRCGSPHPGETHGSLADEWDEVESPCLVPAPAHSPSASANLLTEQPAIASAASKRKASVEQPIPPKSPSLRDTPRRKSQGNFNPPPTADKEKPAGSSRATAASTCAPLAPPRLDDTFTAVATFLQLENNVIYLRVFGDHVISVPLDALGSEERDSVLEAADLCIRRRQGRLDFGEVAPKYWRFSGQARLPTPSYAFKEGERTIKRSFLSCSGVVSLRAIQEPAPTDPRRNILKAQADINLLEQTQPLLSRLRRDALLTLDAVQKGIEEWTSRYRKGTRDVERGDCPHEQNMASAMIDQTIPCIWQNNVFITATIKMDSLVLEMDRLSHTPAIRTAEGNPTINAKLNVLAHVRAAAIETVSCTRPGLKCRLAEELFRLCLLCAEQIYAQASVAERGGEARLLHYQRCVMPEARRQRHGCSCGYDGGREWASRLDALGKSDTRPAWADEIKSNAATVRRVQLWEQAQRKQREASVRVESPTLPDAARRELDRMAREHHSKLLQAQLAAVSEEVVGTKEATPVFECNLPSLADFPQSRLRRPDLSAIDLPLRPRC